MADTRCEWLLPVPVGVHRELQLLVVVAPEGAVVVVVVVVAGHPTVEEDQEESWLLVADLPADASATAKDLLPPLLHWRLKMSLAVC